MISKQAQKSTLDVLPEEIVERILLQVVQPAPAPSSGLASRCAVLLTCRQWYRIALPLFYDTISIKNERQLCQLVATLETSSATTGQGAAAEDCAIGPFIHSLTISCPLSSPKLPRLVSQCTELKSLDLCLDAQSFGAKYNPMLPICGFGGPVLSPTTESLLASLGSLETITHLTLRKDQSVYLTLPKVGQFITGLADCVRRWNDLQSIYIAFRLSDDTGVSALLQSSSVPIVQQSTAASEPTPRSPLTNLTHALALSPRLESVTTHLPSVWNSVLVGLVGDGDKETASSSCSHDEAKPTNLKRIVLLPGAGSPKPGVTPYSTPPPSRPSYSRPSSPDLVESRSLGTSVPGHGLGLSFTPSSAPSRSSQELESEKSEQVPAALPSNSLYLSTAARHHPKLMDLIRAGWKDAFFSSGISYGSMASSPPVLGAGRGRAWTWAGE